VRGRKLSRPLVRISLHSQLKSLSLVNEKSKNRLFAHT
jgi:hypothetical protein